MESDNMICIMDSKKGIQRQRNQDKCIRISTEDSDLFMVYDGVSSNPYSYVFINEYKRCLEARWRLRQYENLSDLFHFTHETVLSKSISGSSTLSVLFMSHEDRTASFMSIGDSRVYRFTNRYIEKITEDHSIPNRTNIITKYLGLESLERTDFSFEETDYDTNYILCTDGFYSLMEKNLKEYFLAFNFKRENNIQKRLRVLQRRKNSDDSSYLIIKHEISS